MLAQERGQARVISRHFSLDPAIMQHMAQLDQPAFPALAGHPGAIHVRKAVREASEKDPTKLSIGHGAHHLFPEGNGQVGVILSQSLVCFNARLISVPRAATARVLRPPLNEARRQEPGQAIPDRGPRHPSMPAISTTVSGPRRRIRSRSSRSDESDIRFTPD